MAMEVEQKPYNEKYVQWLNLPEEERAKTIAPSMYVKELNESNFITTFSLKSNARLLGTSRQYSLLDTISLKVKNQMQTNQCWALAVTTQLESYMAKVESEMVEYSGRHIEYATSKTFLDGINPEGYNRELDSGGNHYQAYAYLASGRGPVLEEDMPFENSKEKINLSEINKIAQAQLKEFIVFPSVYKEKIDGQISYSNGQTGTNRVEYSELQIESFRDEIKEHIMQYGGVLAVTAVNEKEFFSNQTNILASKAYYCDDSTIEADHQVVIVGWDDDYEVSNFNPEHEPTSPGAWIVQNSFGTEMETAEGTVPVFDNGYLYISYEDCLIESYLAGIISLEKIDYDNIYQYDPLGANDSIGSSEYQEMYMANVYTKEEEKAYLSEIGFYTDENESYEIYVNATDGNLSEESLVKVKTVQPTESNYITVKLEKPIELIGEKFAVVIKYIGNQDGVMAPVEANIPGTTWETATSNEKESFGSFDGKQWSDLKELQLPKRSNINACIKAFIVKEVPEQEISLESEKYNIMEQEKQIKNISPDTTVESFISNLTTEATITVYDKNEEEVTQDKIVATGMALYIMETEETYTLIVTGDASGDGKITGTDLLKVKRDLVKIESLIGEYKIAGDVNFSGDITLSDMLKIKQVICRIIEF